jgi:zinc protease
MLNAISLRRAALALALVAAPALAQQPTPPPQSPTKGAVIKNRAPISQEVLKVKLPKATEATLKNGLQVIVLENHKLPIFSMQLVTLTGGLMDPADRPGLAQYTASMLREGTKTRSSRQIAEQIDAVGASLFANAGLSSLTSTVSASGLVENLDQILELFADVILNPSFPADELGKLKGRSVAQLRQQRAQPGFLAGEMFSKVIYGAHPAGRFALTADQIQSFTPEILQRFHATYYRPNNSMLAITGDVKPEEIVAKLERVFGGWERGEVKGATIPPVSDLAASKIYLINRPGSVQTNLILGTLGITRTDPDYFALQVMNQILGGSGSARLFLNLREDKGYTYGAYSNFSSSRYRGTVQASTQVRSEVTEGSMKELLYELRRIREERVPAAELEDAKRSIVGGFALQLESPQSLLGNIVTQKLYGLPADYWDTYAARISAVTAEDVQRVAQKYVDLNRLQVVAVGDAAKISEALRKYGTVEVYDTEGKPVKTPADASAGARPSTR